MLRRRHQLRFTWMHVLRGVFLSYSSERGALQRGVPRHQLKALDTGTSIDPYFSLENSRAMRYYVDSYCHVNSLQGSRSPIGHTAGAIRTSKASFVNSQTSRHHEQNANISSNCLFPVNPY